MRDLLTETEAATKECRIVPPIITRPTAGPQPADGVMRLIAGVHIEFHMCSASKCGHWRWSEHDKFGKDKMLESSGFCGLAGLPKYI